MTTEQLADKWIKDLEEAGYGYDDMIRVIHLAYDKFQRSYRRVYIVRGNCYMDNSGKVKETDLYDAEKRQFYYIAKRYI